MTADRRLTIRPTASANLVEVQVGARSRYYRTTLAEAHAALSGYERRPAPQIEEICRRALGEAMAGCADA